jgi:DNA polymerase-3 subunit alpha
MEELSKKFWETITANRPDADMQRVKEELQYLEESSLLEDVQHHLITVEKNPKRRGDKNESNSAVLFYLGTTTQSHDLSRPIYIPKRRTYGRAGFPDIDMDFDYELRHLIDEYLIQKYGSDKVAKIGTVQQLKTKAAVRRVIKVLDPENSVVFDRSGKRVKDDRSLNFQLEQKVLSCLPSLMKRVDGSFVNSVKAASEEYDVFGRYMQEYPEVYRVARHMEGGISAFGSHAAGMLISPEPLERICPLHVTRGDMDSGKEKTIATQWTMFEVELLGLIKFDILGLSTKTAVNRAHQLVLDRHGIDIDLGNLPLDDQPTLDLLKGGKTDGCFQLENTGMKQTLQQIGISSFDDLIVAIAMYRPGPKDYIPMFARRKHGREQVRYGHPLLEKITRRTFGILSYQEQVMQAFMVLADLTASDGYAFMKGCAKKKRNLIDKYKEPFFKGCKKNEIPPAVTEKIWADMEKFGGYAFNKSHATSYAYESFKTAYLKAHFPIEFITARLSVDATRRNFDDVAKYERDAHANYSLKILHPDLNRSKLAYTIVGESEILRPLIIKGVGDKAAEDIIKHQPYKGKDLFFSFARKVGPNVNTKVVEALYDAGLFGKEKTRKQLLRDFETIKKDQKRNRGRPGGDYPFEE